MASTCPHGEDPDLCEACEEAMLEGIVVPAPPPPRVTKRAVPEPRPEPEDDEDDKPRRRKKDEEPRPIISGHCAFPQTKDPHLSHQRCALNGSGSRANPDKRFHPCPCPCHLAHEHSEEENVSMNRDGTFGGVPLYDCGGCGGIIAEAPVFGTDEDGDPVYVHVDKRTGRMLYRECR